MSRFFAYKFDHILFWILTVSFHAYTRLPWINKAGLGQFFLEIIIRNGLLACSIYLALLFSIPKITIGKKIWQGVSGVLFAIILYVTGKNMHDTYVYGHVLGDSLRQGFFHNTFYNLSIILFYLTFATTLHLSKQWFLQREQMRKIEVEKLNTELEYLRAQINPHFLFNSINTIYFQIDKQNQAARETLGKFSDMLRYQLYECTGNEIAIEKEVQYLQNYVALQKLRVNENYTVNFTIGPDLKNFRIPPLLLIPFVENAFKHVSHFTDKKNEITISLAKVDDQVDLKVTNSTENTPTGEVGGIGLKNVTRRLDLIYGERYSLAIKNHSQTYSVSLEIPVA